MGDCTRSMQAFGALPETVALVADPRPAWIWSRDGARILWANVAGGRRLGVQRLGDLGQRRYCDAHPLRRDLQNAARMAGPRGMVARLRLLDQPRAMPIACRVRRIAAPDGEEGILVVAESAGADTVSGTGRAGIEAEAPAGGGKPADPAEARAPRDVVRSPIPQWMRARLSTFPPQAGAAGPQSEGERLPDGLDAERPEAAETTEHGAGIERTVNLAGLSPQERAAFEEIAASLGASLDGSWPGPPQPPANDDTAPGRVAAQRAARSRQPSPPAIVPSAFCGAVAHPAAPPASSPGQVDTHQLELASILDIATDGVVILDGEGRIESLNGSAEALFGIGQGEAGGQPFAQLLAPGSRAAAMRYFADVRTDGLAGLINAGRELEAQADGGTMPIFVTFGRLGGEASGRFCAVLRDLTQWKQAEAELVAARRRAEEASSHKSDFLARISHEIRTPLNGIIGFADVILEERFGALGNERYREYVRDIRTSGEHVLSLVNDLLDIAKIEAGKLDLNFSTVQLNQLVREGVMLMQPAASRARIILRTSLAADLPGVRADARTIRQVILNILSNAVKFTGAGGQVIVSTGRAEDGVALRVRDTGDGMSEADLVRALEPFRQLGTAPLSDRTGTGLGLPLTKALVEANRASFAISSSKGEGTMVKVAFPAAGLAAEPS